MKRALPVLFFALSFFSIGMQRVFAASWASGNFDGITSSHVMAESGNTGSTYWVRQYVTSTFTGAVSNFNVIGKVQNTGAQPYVGLFDNITTSQSGAGYLYRADLCDDAHDISYVTSTECVATFNLDSPVSVTTGDVIRMWLSTQLPYPGNYITYFGSFQPRTENWISGEVHVPGSGSGSTVSWDALGGPYAGSQFAYTWNYSSSTPGTAPCPENCNSNILFLPGSEGSRLYNEDWKLWEPGVLGMEPLHLNASGTSIGSDIYAYDIIDNLPVSNAPIYESLLEDLQDWKNNDVIAQYAVAPYDWRLSMDAILGSGHRTGDGRIYYSGYLDATSTPYIIEQLKTLAQTSRTGKVTIVAHSYGGLVAKALMKKLENENDPLLSKIDNLVLVAVPQTGTPEALGAGLHGFDLGIPPFVADEEARTFASTTPMLYNLLPSGSYFTDYGSGYISTPPITFLSGSTTQTYIDYYGSQITDNAELSAFLRAFEGRTQASEADLSSPSILSSSLLGDAEALHADIDFWTVPSSTTVYQIAGWGKATLGFLQYADHGDLGGAYLDVYPKITIDGDDTVIVPSALAMSTSTSNVKRYWLNLRAYASSTATELVHRNIFEVPQLRSFILNNVITQSTSTLPSFMSLDQPTAGPGDARLEFFLHSPLALAAYDKFGNEISSTTSTLRDATYRHFGEIQYISLPANSAPVLKLTGYASGSFMLEINEIMGNKVIASSTFSGIPTSTSTRVSMQFLDGTIEHAGPMKIDLNGDGSVKFDIVAKKDGIVDPKNISELINTSKNID